MATLQNDAARATFGVTFVFSILAFGATCARFYARTLQKAGFGPDDWVILTALVVSLAMSMMTEWACFYAAIGVPQSKIGSATAVSFLKVLWINEFLSTLAIGLIKIGVLSFYKRIFTTPRFRLVANVLIGAAICWTIAMLLCFILDEKPTSLNWSLQATPKTLNISAFLLAMVGTDIALDIAILSLPLPMIKSLQLSTNRKILVSGVFWLGAFCMVATIVRLVYFCIFFGFARGVTKEDERVFSNINASIILWTMIEPNASIIAACLPTLMPFFKHKQGLRTWLENARSYFAGLGSRESSRKSSKHSNHGSSTNKVSHADAIHTWHRLDGERSNNDIELGPVSSQPNHANQGGIYVERSFGAYKSEPGSQSRRPVER